MTKHFEFEKPKGKRPTDFVELVEKMLTTHDVERSSSGMVFTPKKKQDATDSNEKN